MRSVIIVLPCNNNSDYYIINPSASTNSSLICVVTTWLGGVPSLRYSTIYKDLRYCVNRCHKDGSIKDQVKKDPGRYIIPDPNVLSMLKRLREQGKKVMGHCFFHFYR